MKLLFENWRKYINEDKEASKKEVETAARDLIAKEGGAIGRKMLKDPEELEPFLKKQGVELPDGFDLDAFIDEFIEGSNDIGVHDHKDIIAADGKEINITKEEIAEGIEIFLEAQEETLDEKRKRKKRKKKKKKAKKRDACYYKVKARYKVWPSAYASGALVKCRNKGAKNWGTGGKKKKKRKNESLSLEDIIREEIQNVLDEACWDTHKQVGMKKKGGRMVPNCVPKEGLSKQELEEENLRSWFDDADGDGQKGWEQIGGKYDGKPCARQPGQKTKPKCASPEKAATMTKAEKESAARRKRKEDPNPDRKGKAKNVSTKPKKRS